MKEQNSKYNPLNSYLKSCDLSYLTLSFNDIENILGFSLPNSYKKYRQSWSNSPKKNLPRNYLEAGYKTYGVDIKNGLINFKKIDFLPPKNDIKNGVILLNKLFLKNEDLSNETINFLYTDNNELYTFFAPNGYVDDLVDVSTDNKNPANHKYFANYLVLTSNKNNNYIDIIYVIKLEEKLQSFHLTKDKDDPRFKEYQDQIKKLIHKRKIKYKNRYLDTIFKDSKTLYISFKSSKIYKALTPIRFEFTKYNYKADKGYLYQDKYNNDYRRLSNILSISIFNESLKLFTPFKLDKDIDDKLEENLSFSLSMNNEYDENLKENIKKFIKYKNRS